MPALYSLVAIGMFVEFPPVGLGWVFCAAALVIGAVLGWQRGKMMRINVDPETHALNQKASPAVVLFIVALIVVRTGARSIMGGGETMFHLNAIVLTDMLIALALGVFSAQRLEMYLRAKKLLDAARASRPA